MSKSHVGIGYTLCPICLEKSADEILMDKKGRERFESGKKYFLGMEICKKHQDLMNQGLIAVLVVRKKPTEADTFLSIDRTGEVFFVSEEVFFSMFKKEPPKDKIALVPEEVGAQILEAMDKNQNASSNSIH